jgi:esterase/lipase
VQGFYHFLQKMKKINTSKTSTFESLLKPSGLNTKFMGEDSLSFADYVQRTRHIITQARVDLQGSNASLIVEANSPFLWLPASSMNIQQSTAPRWSKGMLLIHGLFDSPFMLRDIGTELTQQGFYVQSVLLPGHGTVPADLLEIHYTEWLKAVEYGIHDLAQKVDEVYLAGFSLGGALAIHHALQKPFIKGLLLLSPAIRLKDRFMHYIHCHHWLPWVMSTLRWYRRNPQHTYAKYESFAFNAAYQIYLLIQHNYRLLMEKRLEMPLFIVASQDDENISATALRTFFNNQRHPDSRMIWYSNVPTRVNDARILVRPSAYPDLKILDFSHTCIPIAPSNSHYGQQGDYQDFQHYHYQITRKKREIYLGATHQHNLRRHLMQRLSYNPDFTFMMQMAQDVFAC